MAIHSQSLLAAVRVERVSGPGLGVQAHPFNSGYGRVTVLGGETARIVPTVQAGTTAPNVCSVYA